MLTLKIKPFEELSAREVYEILGARCDVFSVEQKICYPDADGVDLQSLHVWLEADDGTVEAYLRLYRESGTSAEGATTGCDSAARAAAGLVHMGRVLTRRNGEGLGRRIVEAGIETAWARMGADEIRLHSQEYCIGFYGKMGFRVCSDLFDEAGIPHAEMTLLRPAPATGVSL